MSKIIGILVICFAVLSFTACPPGTETGNTNASNTNGEGGEKSLQAQIEEIDDQFGVEMSKKNDAFFDEHVVDNFVGMGNQGRMDKAQGLYFIKNNKCEGKPGASSDRKVHELADGVALLTGQGTGEQTCDGKTEKSTERYAVLWVKDGDKWKGAFYHQIMLTQDTVGGDDAAKPEEKPAADAEAKKEEKPAADGEAKAPMEMPKENAPNDAELAKTLLDIEKTLWGAWAKGETKPFEDTLADKFVALGTDGETDKAGEIKMIGEGKCEVKSWSLSGEKATKINDNFVVLTYTGNQDGACNGKALDKKVFTSTIFMKDGDSWKPVFHANSAAKEG